VLVNISNITYTALRIVVRDSSDISNLAMTLDQDTTLKVMGLRSDGQGWEYVKANWAATAGLHNATPAPGSSLSWDIAPSDTGSAWVKVTLGTATPDSVRVVVGKGMARYIVLYPADGAPGGTNIPYPGPGEVIWDSAGKALPVVAKVFDRANNWLSTYDNASSPVTWKIVEFTGNLDVPTGTLAPTPATGYKATLTATRANNTIYVIAQFQAAGGQPYLDTIKVTVTPGKPDHLSMEPTSDAAASPHRDNPADSVQIPSNESFGLVYAVVRDRYGNFIIASQHTVWLSRDTTVVTAADGQKSLGQGVITRNPLGVKNRSEIVATNQDYGLTLSDSTMAIVLKYYYVALRIVDVNGNPISTLNMNTNQDATLRVQGQRSTPDSSWEDVYANWENSPALSIVPVAPGNANIWTFSPDKPGVGIIRVTLGDTTVTKPGFINANFTVGPPVSIETEILTPPGDRIAGGTIIAVTRIRNKDGLVPGTWCDSTTYQNALGSGGRPKPTVDSVNMGTTMYECFKGGIDTVKYVLYYAPVSPDSLEKVMVTIRGGLNASSEPFRVYPGALARISLEDFNGKNLDSIYLVSPTGSKLIIAAGYDAYGNYRGPENSNWTVNGTLHAIDKAAGVPRVFYETGGVKYDENGYIRASATGPGGVVVSDSARVVITGRAATLLSAVTHDTSGNGLLDEITLVFDRKVTLPAGTRIQLSNGQYTLVVSGIRGQTSGTSTAVNPATGLTEGAVGSDSVFTVVLTESNKSVPQTGWEPSLTMSGVSGMSVVNGYSVQDGAGPVIWSIVKTIGGPSDRTQDKVTVTFSEPIGTNGNDFTPAMPPSGIFHVWEIHVSVNGDTTYTEVPGMLSGITEFFKVENGGQSVSFYMSNGKDLTTRDYLNIVFDSTGRITDKNPPLVNGPVPTNQRVEVTVKSVPAREILVVPNPSVPTFVRQRPGELHLEHQPNGRQWVRQDGGGTVMTFRIAPATGEIVTGYLKIYDVIGNIVFSVDSSKSKGGIVPPSWASSDSSAHDYDIYWNGSNAQGTKVAAGVYQAMLFLKYTDQAGKSRNSRLLGTVGISRQY
jgi:hypothetical protein